MIHLLNILSIGCARDAGDVYSVVFIFIKNATALTAAIVRQESVYRQGFVFGQANCLISTKRLLCQT